MADALALDSSPHLHPGRSPRRLWAGVTVSAALALAVAGLVPVPAAVPGAGRRARALPLAQRQAHMPQW